MEETLSAALGQVGVGRPKMWNELSVEEKLERLREQVKSTQNNSYGMNHRFYQIEDTLHNHTQLQNGEVMVKARSRGYGGEVATEKSLHSLADEKSGNVYF